MTDTDFYTAAACHEYDDFAIGAYEPPDPSLRRLLSSTKASCGPMWIFCHRMPGEVGADDMNKVRHSFETCDGCVSAVSHEGGAVWIASRSEKAANNLRKKFAKSNSVQQSLISKNSPPEVIRELLTRELVLTLKDQGWCRYKGGFAKDVR